MTLLTLGRIVRLGLINYWRNRGLSISATLVLTLTLFIVVVFVLINLLIQMASQEIRNKVDMVITFDDEIAAEDIGQLQSVLAARPETAAVQFVSKEEALQRFQNLPGISDTTKQLVTPDNNPLPRSLEIKAVHPDRLETLNQILSESPWQEIIRKNSYTTNRETILSLTRFERAVTLTGLVLSAIFVFLSMIVVTNTVRLAIFARREEIEIMRLVGANNMFIRVPFIVESLLYGLVATILAMGLVWVFTRNLDNLLSRYLAGVSFNLPTLFSDHWVLLAIIAAITGLAVAIFASLFSIQRYLKR